MTKSSLAGRTYELRPLSTINCPYCALDSSSPHNGRWLPHLLIPASTANVTAQFKNKKEKQRNVSVTLSSVQWNSQQGQVSFKKIKSGKKRTLKNLKESYIPTALS